MAETSRQFSLRHTQHESKLNKTLYSMFLDQSLVDVILYCDGNDIKAHRLILSANSSYFKTLFDSLESNRCQIPVIVLKDVPFSDLKAILEFMYRGEVSVEERHLSSVLQSAEFLKVFGLTEVCHALNSRNNNQTNVEMSPLSDPNPSSNKRPRISDGIQKKIQTSPDFISKIANTRFEIRSNTSAPISLTTHSNQQQLGSMAPKVIPPLYPSLVKNVILPPTQIHRMSDSSGSQIKATEPKTSTIESIRGIGSPQKTPPLKSYSRGFPFTKKPPIVEEGLTNQNVSSFTPSQSQPSLQQQSSDPLPSNSGIQSKHSIEVLIDEETDVTEEDIEQDIKPSIFELDQSLSDKNVVVLDIESDSNRNESSDQISNNQKPNITKTSKLELKPSSQTTKSRTSSTSCQSSIPPPPSYLVVQRSSSRFLRNIIKPTTKSSTSLKIKGKDNSEDTTNVKKERQSIRLIRQKRTKSDTTEEKGPEVECPSCGLKFNDDKKWNEHITKAHPPFQT